MKIYSLRLRVKSPLICTEKQIGNVLKHSVIYLRGHTLRGGFLRLAYEEHPNEVVDESKIPQLIFHPAYPVFKELDTKPAHPFIYSCKICNVTEEKDPYEVLSELKKNNIPEATICKNGHIFSMRTLAGSLIAKKNGCFERNNLKFTNVKSVGINRLLKGAEYKMLYEYVALSPGLEFKGFIVDLGDKVERLKLTEKDEIRIGGGITRGFGRVSVKIAFEKDMLDKESERIKRIIRRRNGTIILRALSPTFRFKKDLISTEPFPNITGFEKWLNPIELRILNGNAAITNFEEFSGFSNASRLPTPRLIGAGVGSLFFYEIDKNYENEASKKLSEKRFTGFGPFSAAGLNILEVYDIE